MQSTVLNIYRKFWMSKIGLTYMMSTVVFGISSALTMSVETVYLRNVGFSFTQIGVIWSTYLITSALLDFPTGNVADKLGRKTTYCTGMLFTAAGHLIYSLGYGIEFFLVGAFFIGFGEAQISGSLAAWMVDEVKKVEKEKEVGKVFGDTQLAMSAAGIVTGFLIGSFYHGPIGQLFFWSGVVLLLSALWIWISLENNYGKSEMKWLEFQVTTVRYYLGSRLLIMVSMNMVLAFCCYSVYVFVYQPAAVACGIRQQQLGTLYSVYLLSTGLGGFIFGRLCSKIHFNTLMPLNFVAFGCSFFFFLTRDIYLIAVGLTLFSFGFGGYKPVLAAWSNALIPNEIRASTISLIGTIGSGSVFLLQPIIGRLIDMFGASAAIFLGEVFVVWSILLFVIIKREESLHGNRLT